MKTALQRSYFLMVGVLLLTVVYLLHPATLYYNYPYTILTGIAFVGLYYSKRHTRRME